MNEYRCTRPSLYGPRTPGFTDHASRQGYYIKAPNEYEAWNRMKKMFPEDKFFDVELWKQNQFTALIKQSDKGDAQFALQEVRERIEKIKISDLPEDQCLGMMAAFKHVLAIMDEVERGE